MSAGDVPLWITAVQWVSRSVLVLLVLLSIYSIATMLKVYQILKNSEGPTSPFAKIQKLLQEKNLRDAVTTAVGSFYEKLLQEFSGGGANAQNIDRATRALLVQKKVEVEAGLSALATLGSNAPFIGLFGTVLGIIQAFGALGAQQSNPSSVMVGISEALVATAVGLFVAIPAVVAFNILSRKLRVLVTNCESLRDLYVAKFGA